MAAGQGFKTFTTGEVLTAADVNGYLMQGINVFASSAARSAAITSPQEGQYSFLKDTNALEYYDGAAWVGAPVGDITAVTAGKGLTGGGSSGDVTVSLATTAKGDLVAGSGASTAAVLTVGNNGETLVADSSTATGLRYQVPVQQNPVLNSAFQVWQRGTSSAITASSTSFYLADRWQSFRGTTGSTISRQATGDTTNLPFIQYCARVQRDSGNTATNTIFLSQNFESINAIPFAGKSVVLSFYARAGANFSSSSSLLPAQLIAGTGTDQNWVSGYTGQTVPINQNVTLTTTWQRFSVTGTIASTATELAVSFNYAPTGTAGANDYFEVTGVQLEVGSVATPFKTYAGTIQGELAACQRYYQKTNNQSETPGTAPTSTPINAINASSTLVVGVPPFKVTMRTAPTITLYSPVTGTTGKIRSGGADITASAADVGEVTVGYISATGLTAGSNSAIAYTASAEL